MLGLVSESYRGIHVRNTFEITEDTVFSFDCLQYVMNFLSLFLFKQKIDLEILRKDFLNWGRKCADHLKAPFQTFTTINPMRKTKTRN